MTARNAANPQSRWTRAVLGVSGDAAPPDVRRAAFDRLREAAFDPAADCREALFVMQRSIEAMRRPPRMENRKRWQRRRLQEMIEEFASRYFQRSPFERRARWRMLLACAARFPRERHRLRSLESALDLPDSLPVDAPECVVDLVDRLKRVYFAQGNDRYRMQAALFAPTVAAIGDDRADQNAMQLCRTYPEWTVLNPQLVDRLCCVNPQPYQRLGEAQATRLWCDPPQDAATNSLSQDQSYDSYDDSTQPSVVGRISRLGSSSSRSFGWILIAIGLLLLWLVAIWSEAPTPPPRPDDRIDSVLGAAKS